jgi:G:T/U-mismatch repair DNA glycosylase
MIGIPATCLPSTSPANAAVSLDRLIEAWRVIRIEKSPI